MNDIQIFNSPQFGEIRTSGTSEEPLFCLADVCRALGINNPSMVKERIKKSSLTTIEVAIPNQYGATAMHPMTFINEANLYRCIFQSRKKQAEQFQDWVTDEVLPSIRKTGAYHSTMTDNTLQEKMQAAAWAAEFLNLTAASKLLMAQTILNPMGLPLPDYAPSEKAEPTVHSATHLLKQHGVKLSAQAFNSKLVERGICSRQFRKGSKGITHTWVVLNPGYSDYGQNVVNPQNMQQTQVQWYDETFPTILTKIGYEK